MYELINKLDPQSRTAIIALIDIKAEEQMEAVASKLDLVMNKIDALDQKIDAKINALDQKIDSKIDSLEKICNAKFDSIEKRLSFLQWSMMVGFSAIALVVTVLKLTS
jgi:genome sequencing data, contig C324